MTLTAAGEADKVKLDDELTVSATVVVRVSAGVPPVPLIVTLTGPPTVAPAAAVKVTTLLLPVVGSGLKAAVTPVGRPLALRSTEAVKLVRVMAIVLVAVDPWVTPTAAGEAESAKSGVPARARRPRLAARRRRPRCSACAAARCS